MTGRYWARRAGHWAAGLAFDGTYLWAANAHDYTVDKRRVDTGAVVGTYHVGELPMAMVFDGTNVWVANEDDCTVTKLRASDGVTLELCNTCLSGGDDV